MTARMLHGIAGISAAPDVHGGAPCIDGTRIPVELVLRYLADLADNSDPDPWAELIDQYPSLTPESLAAAFRFAAHATERDHIGTIKSLRRRVQAAEKAARARLGEAKRDGGFGRDLARWAAADAERRASAAAAVLDRARAVHAEQCAGGCALCAVLGGSAGP